VLDAITLDLTGRGAPRDFYWISGAGLLSLAQYAMDGINTTGLLPDGDGSYHHPWNLTGNALQWLALSQHLRNYTGLERYFWICGRFVKKLSGQCAYYMVDAGGDQMGRAWDQKLVYNWRQHRWVGEDFERGGPSYRNYANYMEQIRGNSTKGLSNETWSQHKAEKLRRVLKCDPLYADKLSRKGDWTTGQVLPVLAATMFLAEPARNIRAFLADKIILDMMEQGITYGGRKVGSVPKQYVWSTTLLRDPQGKGGKMPAAMAGSADAGFRKSAIQPDKNMLGTGFYTQAKELTLLCHYFTFGSYAGTNEAAIDKRVYTQIPVNINPPINNSAEFATTEGILGYLKYLLQFTVRTWDA
jgi:hypothetical protein